MQADVIIVGQGIAGSVLAHQCYALRKRILVIDDPALSRCSSVAAGIWNPIVFKRLTKSWMADEVLPVMHKFYEQCGQRLSHSFLQDRHIIKPFTERQEADLWLRKAGEGNQYLDPHIHETYTLSPQDHTGAYATVKQAGNLHVQAFLERTRDYLRQQGALLEEVFDHQALVLEPGGVRYKNTEATHIIFCEGPLIRENPIFQFIPMKPAKGEVLTIFCKGLELGQDIFNKNLFIMPLGDHRYKIGATYAWDDLTDQPTEQAQQELTTKLEQILHVPYKILDHEAGVRPSVIDRRPVLGTHADKKQVGLFNGFGTKGVMLAPYFAEVLTAHLFFGEKIPGTVDLNRFR